MNPLNQICLLLLLIMKSLGFSSLEAADSYVIERHAFANVILNEVSSLEGGPAAIAAHPKLPWILLNAGRIDDAYEVLSQNPNCGRRDVIRYFFEMAAAGRESELSEKLIIFSEHQWVKGAIKDDPGQRLEPLFRLPTMVGRCVHAASNGDLETSIELLRELSTVPPYTNGAGRDCLVLIGKSLVRSGKYVFCGQLIVARQW